MIHEMIHRGSPVRRDCGGAPHGADDLTEESDHRFNGMRARLESFLVFPMACRQGQGEAGWKRGKTFRTGSEAGGYPRSASDSRVRAEATRAGSGRTPFFGVPRRSAGRYLSISSAMNSPISSRSI